MARQLKTRIVLAAAAVVASSLVGRRARPGAHVRRHGCRASLRRRGYRLPLLLDVGAWGGAAHGCPRRTAPAMMMRAPRPHVSLYRPFQDRLFRAVPLYGCNSYIAGDLECIRWGG